MVICSFSSLGVNSQPSLSLPLLPVMGLSMNKLVALNVYPLMKGNLSSSGTPCWLISLIDTFPIKALVYDLALGGLSEDFFEETSKQTSLRHLRSFFGVQISVMLVPGSPRL